MAAFPALLLCVLLLGASAKPQTRQKRQADVECSYKTYDIGTYNPSTFSSSDCGTDENGNYPNEANWQIAYTVPQGANFVNVEYLVDIEDSNNCIYDKLTFGAERPGEVVELCGLREGNFSLELSGEDVFKVAFVSDYSVNAAGFEYTIYFTDDYADFPMDNLPSMNGPRNNVFNANNDYFDNGATAYNGDYTSTYWSTNSADYMYSSQPYGSSYYYSDNFSPSYGYTSSYYPSSSNSYNNDYNYPSYDYYSSYYSHSSYPYSSYYSYSDSYYPSSDDSYSSDYPSFSYYSSYSYDYSNYPLSFYSYYSDSYYPSSDSYYPSSDYSYSSDYPSSSYYSSYSSDYSNYPYSFYSYYSDSYYPSSDYSYSSDYPSYSYSYQPYSSDYYNSQSYNNDYFRDAPSTSSVYYPGYAGYDNYNNNPPQIPTTYQTGCNVQQMTMDLSQLRTELAELKSAVEESQQALQTFEDYLYRYAYGTNDQNNYYNGYDGGVAVGKK